MQGLKCFIHEGKSVLEPTHSSSFCFSSAPSSSSLSYLFILFVLPLLAVSALTVPSLVIHQLPFTWQAAISFLSSAPSFHAVTCHLQQGCFTCPGLFATNAQAGCPPLIGKQYSKRRLKQAPRCIGFLKLVLVSPFGRMPAFISLSSQAMPVFAVSSDVPFREDIIFSWIILRSWLKHVGASAPPNTFAQRTPIWMLWLLASQNLFCPCLFFFPPNKIQSQHEPVSSSVLSLVPRVWSVSIPKYMHALF